MQRKRIVIAPSAVADLEAMLAWYDEQGSVIAGRRMARKLLAATRELARFPEMGRIVPEFDSPAFRELIRPPYRIVYRLDDGRISVIRIWRSERLIDEAGLQIDDSGDTEP